MISQYLARTVMDAHCFRQQTTEFDYVLETWSVIL